MNTLKLNRIGGWLGVAFLTAGVFIPGLPSWAGSHSAVYGPVSVDTRDAPSSIFQIYPSVSTSVLAGAVSGLDAYSLQINMGQATEYVEFYVDDGSTTPDVRPAGKLAAIANRFRMSAGGATTLAINNASDIQYHTGAGWSSDTSWSLNEWQPALYTWHAKPDGTSGSFRLGRVTLRAGSGKSATPVAMLHGLAGDAEATLYNGSWTATSGLSGYLGQTRPVYTFEYPNTDNIKQSAVILGTALAHIAAAHNAGSVNIVAHSMGGVVTRYYKGKLGGSHLGRFVSLGSPYEGSFAAGIASVAGEIEDPTLATGFAVMMPYLIDLLQQRGYSLENLPGAGSLLGAAGTHAAFQLIDPGNTLGIWGNANANVAGDLSLLTICGTEKLLGLIDISTHYCPV